MIIGRERMVQLGPLAYFKRQVLQWGGVTVPMKKNSSLLRQADLTRCDMRKVVMNTAEPVSTI